MSEWREHRNEVAAQTNLFKNIGVADAWYLMPAEIAVTHPDGGRPDTRG